MVHIPKQNPMITAFPKYHQNKFQNNKDADRERYKKISHRPPLQTSFCKAKKENQISNR